MKRNLLKLIAIVLLVMSFGITHASAAQNENSKEVLNNAETPPGLEDGQEAKERLEHKPISNIILQQRYPNTVVLRGSLNENKVALTFDDGPDPRFTPQILDILSEYGVPATFFQMGIRAKAYPDLVKRIAKEGHVIGNHTYTHPNLVEEGDIAVLEEEVKKTEETINNIVGYRPKLFRAPYGFLYNELVEKLKDMDYSVVAWSADSLDWQQEEPEVITYNVLSNTQPGAIILMHDGASKEGDRTNTIKALREIIPALKDQGIEFVTVPELLNIPYKK
jgi:peptidoglycan/xylan/chitin deacetylase (PgdA/CDA1 family)